MILRSRDEGLTTSPRIGKGLSGNGGLLSFGYDLDQRLGQVNPVVRPGPTISGMVECRDNDHWDQSFIVQDGSWPRLMDTIFRITKPMLPIKLPFGITSGSSLKRIFNILNPFTTALQRTQVYLTLSHDTPCGSITLQKDVPLLDMRGVECKPTSARIKKLLTEMTFAFGGSYIEQGCKVTVHPLGGLGFASDGTGRTGSVNHLGELLTGDGSDVHSGLCVVDGSAISRSLAANPLATITAVAERSVELLAEKSGLSIDLESTKPFLERKRDSLITFSEKMEGNVTFKGSRVPLVLYVDLAIPQIEYAVHGEATGRLSGTIRCSHLSTDQLMITNGTFRMFEPDQKRADLSTMEYEFDAIATNGMRFSMLGRKLLSPAVTLSASKLWQATTTLYIAIESMDDLDAGSGVLELSVKHFIDQMRTITTSGDDIYGQRAFLAHFLKMFASGLLERFLSPFAPLHYAEEFTATKNARGFHKVAPKLKVKLRALDDVASTLRMWGPVESQNNGNKTVFDILLVPGSAVSHWIYASPYIKQNAVEYFTQKGYRCWCVTTRFGKQIPNRADTAHAWTGYDGRLDIAAALAEIKRYNAEQSSGRPSPPKPPYVIAHCVGSLALASALLSGTVHQSDIPGITASQIFLHPVLQPLNELKARSPLTRLYRTIAGDWFPIAQTKAQASSNIIQSILDTLLRFYPLSCRSEICNSPICHRCNLAFGRLWNHRNLNKATHDNQHHIFGGTSSTCLEQLASGGRRQTVLDNNYCSLVTEPNLERLRELPIFLLSGADNSVFKASSTLKTYEVLRDRGGVVSRKEFAGFGHLDCWMSERSADVVYPAILREVRKVMVDSSDLKAWHLILSESSWEEDEVSMMEPDARDLPCYAIDLIRTE